MDKKGISVVSLVITILVIVLIASITVYQGQEMVDNTRERATMDRLMTISVAIVAHEEELGYADRVLASNDPSIPENEKYVQITSGDYVIMGLEDFNVETNFAPVFVYKTALDNLRTYKLKSWKTVSTNGAYKDADKIEYTYNYYEEQVRESLKPEFDEAKNVNRPLLTADMTPVKTFFDDDGNVQSKIVEDIFTEDWYNYSTISPFWANVMTDKNVYYVWIPRFAYKIQNFYLITDFKSIPASAIDILFLKEDTDYLINDEVLPAGYQVHPAFKYKEGGKEKNITGFWVAKNNIDNLVNSFSAATSSALGAYSGASNVTSRLLKNTEWAAIAYLSMHTVGRCDNGMSLNPNNPSGVFELDVKCYTAAGLESHVSSVSYADKYSYDDEFLTYSSYEDEGKKYGDAIIATSSGLSTQSAWFAGTSIKPTEDEPLIARGIDGNLFAYSAISSSSGAGCRNVLIVD